MTKQEREKMKPAIKELNTFIRLWSTQSLSQLGSAMTSFALTLWLYDQTGSALQTALLSICSYAPYVLMSIFAGALSDRWDKKKVMLICDTLAACSTVVIFVLLRLQILCPAYLYILNALNGLMNTVQQPASDVAMTLITPQKHFQKTSGMRSISQSLVTILHPIIATALYAFGGMEIVIIVDLGTFSIAFLTLLFSIKIPKIIDNTAEKETLLSAAKSGLQYLKRNKMILYLILFLAAVNFIASAFDAVLPAYILPRNNGGSEVMGMVMSCAGIATLIGGVFVTLLPAPKNRIRVICITMLISLSLEHFVLGLTREPILWCIGQLLGWLPVPIMGASMDVILRSTIPANMQGRVFSCRNTLQFFTIPIGLFWGGVMVDKVCEPLMAVVPQEGFMSTVFGTGKGSGAALMMFILGILGTIICLVFTKLLSHYHYEEKSGDNKQMEEAKCLEK